MLDRDEINSNISNRERVTLEMEARQLQGVNLAGQVYYAQIVEAHRIVFFSDCAQFSKRRATVCLRVV